MIQSSTISGGSGKEERKAFDFYATPKEVTIALMNFINLPKECIIWEPACGEGHMVDAIISLGYENLMWSDIRVTEYSKRSSNFLNPDITYVDAIITNPPFNLAEDFIRTAINRADMVCMLLKAHFWHAKKRYRLFIEHRPTFVLPLTWRPDWTNGGSGSSPTMDFQWTVWKKRELNALTFYEPLQKPKQTLV